MREFLRNQGLTWEEQTLARLSIARAKRDELAEKIRILTKGINGLKELEKGLEELMKGERP